jgi:hypothetical protein
MEESKDLVPISCHKKWNLDYLLKVIWNKLDLTRVYTKKKGSPPDLESPVVLRDEPSVFDLCKGIHKDFHSDFKYAMVWGSSVKHNPQKVGLTHKLDDEDVVQIVLK